MKYNMEKFNNKQSHRGFISIRNNLLYIASDVRKDLTIQGWNEVDIYIDKENKAIKIVPTQNGLFKIMKSRHISITGLGMEDGRYYKNKDNVFVKVS